MATDYITMERVTRVSVRKPSKVNASDDKTGAKQRILSLDTAQMQGSIGTPRVRNRKKHSSATRSDSQSYRSHTFCQARCFCRLAT